MPTVNLDFGKWTLNSEDLLAIGINSSSAAVEVIGARGFLYKISTSLAPNRYLDIYKNTDDFIYN